MPTTYFFSTNSGTESAVVMTGRPISRASMTTVETFLKPRSRMKTLAFRSSFTYSFLLRPPIKVMFFPTPGLFVSLRRFSLSGPSPTITSFAPGFGKNITFMGGLSRKEYVKELRKASVFILLLGFRNVSTVVMEALEMGLPVITTADSVPEFVEKKYVVGIQNPEDARETASVILKVLENPGKFAAKKPETLSWKESAKRHLEIYRKILPEELGGRRPH